jgi:hypothetical protein
MVGSIRDAALVMGAWKGRRPAPVGAAAAAKLFGTSFAACAAPAKKVSG